MDAAWVGVVSALAGVGLTGGLSLAGGVLARRHDRDERRYEIRRDAYVSFDSTIERALSTIRAYVREVGERPGDYETGGWREAELRGALSLVRLVEPEAVATAAEATHDAVIGFGYVGTSADAEDMRAKFVAAAQEALRLT